MMRRRRRLADDASDDITTTCRGARRHVRPSSLSLRTLTHRTTQQRRRGVALVVAVVPRTLPLPYDP